MFQSKKISFYDHTEDSYFFSCKKLGILLETKHSNLYWDLDNEKLTHTKTGEKELSQEICIKYMSCHRGLFRHNSFKPGPVLPAFLLSFALPRQGPYSADQISTQMGKVIELHNTEGGYEIENFKGDEACQEDPSFGGYNLLPFPGEEEDSESFPVMCVISQHSKELSNFWEL